MVKLDLFEIKEKKDTKLKYISKNLPKPPFRWVLCGATNSGKSTVAKNVIFNDKFYKKYFDEIYLFCGSIDDIQKLRIFSKRLKMENKLKIIGPNIDLDQIDGLYSDIEKENSEVKNPSRVLFIFDDLISGNNFNGRKMNIIDKTFVQGRHINLSVMITTQIYKALNPNIRSRNVSAITVYGNNIDELEQIAKEHSNHLTKYELLDILKETQTKKYNFITINYSNDIENRFLDNEFKPLQVKEKK